LSSGKRKPSFRSYHGRRSARRSLLAAKKSHKEAVQLSESIADALNETWRLDEEPVAVTPSCSRPFVEVTPRLGPAVQLVDSNTPRPEYSAMKTASLQVTLA